MLRNIRLVAFVLIFGLAGFYASWWYRAQPGSTGLTGLTVPGDGELVAALPEFSLADMNGDLRPIREFLGRPLLINFWATWCAPCLREMPMLETVWQQRKKEDRLRIVGIAIDRPDAVGPYVEKTGVTYPILVGQSDAMAAADAFGPAYVGLPFTVVVAPGGEILMTYSGELEREQLDGILATVERVAAGGLSIDDARSRLTR